MLKHPALILLATLAALPAAAQTPPRTAPQPAPAPATPPRPAASPETPERTLAVFGDWAVACEARAANAAGRICQMSQTTQNQQQQSVAVLAIGRVARAEPWRMVAQLPVNVQVSQPARLAIDMPISLGFRQCTPRGCFAEAELRDEAALRRLRAHPAETVGRLEWRDATGSELGIPVSFRGFTAAFEALVREAE